MEGCDLELDVNGGEVFFVNKEILATYSGRLTKLFNQSSEATKIQKVKLNDLPGGAKAFELMIRFCYSNGRVNIDPSNTCLLHSVAHFMEMRQLLRLAEKSLEGIPFWSWSEIMNAIEQCQDSLLEANSTRIFEKVVDSLVGRIATSIDTSPSDSSPESSAVRFSCDSASTISKKPGSNRAWWSEDLILLKIETMKKIIGSMVSHKLDHVIISRFLFYYLKCKFSKAKSVERRRATELVIDMLFSLERSCVSCKNLFGILRASMDLNLSKCCRNQLEEMIGSQMDQATLDDLLIPAPTWMDSLYDVNLILRFLKSFLDTGGATLLVTRLKRVGRLMDMYTAEIAPDPSLKLSKFVAVTTALPEPAVDSHDSLYRAIDMYLEVHNRLSEDEKMKICSAINFEKLSSECCKHLANNANIPSRTAVQALISQQSKLKRLLQGTRSYKSFGRSPQKQSKCKEGEQIILYAKKVDLSVENENLKSHLQGMQWKVIELEKVCRKMESQLAKLHKAKLSGPLGYRSLPRLCS